VTDLDTTAPVALVIDSDCGIDDAVAIWWAAIDPRVELLGITTVWGNVGVEDATVNVCRILHESGRSDVPVAIGASSPWGPAPDLLLSDFIHGADGVADLGYPPAPLQPVDETAVELLLRLVAERPGEITVVTVGPMANIAAVLAADPTWSTRVKRLVVMGGAFVQPGNAMPVGEANIAHDPVAASVALAADWGTPPLLVGLDVTYAATLTLDEIALAREGRTPAARYLAELLAFYQRFGGTFSAPGEFPCHDALATMAAVRPNLVTGPVLPVAVETNGGPAWGMTVADRRQPFFARSGQSQAMPSGFHPAEVGTDVDGGWFRDEVRRLFGDDGATA
jgi:purine nucleosidase